jgi:hypothetical protein
VDAKGAVAIPLANDAGEVVAVAGVAYGDERELSPQVISELTERARALLG